MCAIAGIWHKESDRLNTALLSDALKLMKHRGPDQSGMRRDGDVLIGASRLEIIDLKMASQPFYDDTGRSLVFNGAIYNYPELAERYEIKAVSDTCVLFELLKEFDDLAIEKLRGMFAFAYHNSANNELLLARDRVGQKPLYYYHGEHCFLFASELKGLKTLMIGYGIEPQVNEEAIYQYLCFSNIPEPNTIYKNVFALEPGYLLKFKNGTLETTQYWNYDYLPKRTLGKARIVKETKALISEAVKIRLRADVPIGLFLSGGWDSSVVAYEASLISKQLKTFTINYPFNTSQNEAKVAKETAKLFGLEHQTIAVDIEPEEALKCIINTFDQPFADSSAIPNLAIAKAAGAHVKVMLNGDGGDEQFGGYRRYFLAKNEGKLNPLRYLNSTLGNDRRSYVGFLGRISTILKQTDVAKYLAYTTDMLRPDDMEEIWLKSQHTAMIDQLFERKSKPQLSNLDQLMHLDRKFNLQSGILVKMDRASMQHSVEARSPLLDHKLFQFTSRLPDDYKVNGFNRKYLLKEIYRNKLPKSVVKGRKKSFEAPLRHWLDNDFKKLIADLLGTQNAKIYDFLKYEEVQLILNRKKYRARNLDYIIYSLLILELWLQQNT